MTILVSTEEVAKYIGMYEPDLYTMVYLGALPHFRYQQKVWLDLGRVEKIFPGIEKNTLDAITEKQAVAP